MRLPVLLLLILVPLVGLLLLVSWPFPANAWWRVIQDFGHVALFVVITVAIYSYWRFPARGSSGRALSAAAGLAVLIGAGTELLQTSVGRNGSWGDFRHDLVGIGIAVGALAAFDSWVALSRSLRRLLGLLALIALVAAATPVVQMYRAYTYRDGNFPQLAAFRDAREYYWVLARGVRREVIGNALAIEFGSDRYPGVSWHEPVPDWRGFRTLALEVSNPNDTTLEITLRVHDRAHNLEYADRFNRAISLRPQERREVRVSLDDVRDAPVARAMDLDRISEISIFRSSGAGPRKLLIHRLALER